MDSRAGVPLSRPLSIFFSRLLRRFSVFSVFRPSRARSEIRWKMGLKRLVPSLFGNLIKHKFFRCLRVQKCYSHTTTTHRKTRKIFSCCHFSAFLRIIFIVFHRVSLFVCHCCCHCLHCLFANLFMCMYMYMKHIQAQSHLHTNTYTCALVFLFFNLYVPIRLS